ncbi:UDP-N-acetylmuramoyl-tripeptide--D-alanyl-D-alanine ligase [Candidatus Daviesbacteria bacterium]|nr:UDP-N-acetylmuramoyl-tripeptide--D-alanyl-D-alanine ligase [Candidatus Daviesbacteria bacterium]
MKKLLSKIFPLFDHLYIYQVFEYNSQDYLRWFLKNPTRRNLQKKHQLEWTKKALALFITSTVLIIMVSIYITASISPNLISLYLIFLFLLIFSPVFLVISNFLYTPLESYLKGKILSQAKETLAKLPNLKVVAITGSFGKTSTKDILYTLLFKKYYVVKTPKSFNTPIGIAQTVMDLVKEKTDIFICEIGAYKRGEIAKIANLVKPQIGIITAVAPQHLQAFGTLENIAHAKFELPQALEKNGTAILNSTYEQIKNNASSLSAKVIFYGSNNDPFYATDIKTGTDGTEFTIHTPKGKADIKIPLTGEHHVQNLLAASVAALQLGLTLSEIKDRAKLMLPTPHRLEIKKQGSMTIIDNTYNTNPEASRASLKLLSEYPATQRIIITPGLVELGQESSKENQEFAKDTAKVVDEFIIVGENAKEDLLKGLSDFPKTKIHLVSSTQNGIKLLSTLATARAVILLENDLPDQYF